MPHGFVIENPFGPEGQSPVSVLRDSHLFREADYAGQGKFGRPSFRPVRFTRPACANRRTATEDSIGAGCPGQANSWGGMGSGPPGFARAFSLPMPRWFPTHPGIPSRIPPAAPNHTKVHVRAGHSRSTTPVVSQNAPSPNRTIDNLARSAPYRPIVPSLASPSPPCPQRPHRPPPSTPPTPRPNVDPFQPGRSIVHSMSVNDI